MQYDITIIIFTMYSQPVVQILPLGQPHNLPKINPGLQTGLSLLV